MGEHTRSILAIDGNASMVFYLTTLLTRLGYAVSTARSAEEAIRHMNAEIPTLVLTEIALPKMNGISLLKIMLASPLLKSVPVIILTSETDPGLRDTCLRAGCAAYLNKPFDPDVLYRNIQSVSESIPRQNIRLATSFPVTVGELNVSGGENRIEYALAISEGGMYIRTLYPLNVNALSPLLFSIEGRTMKVKAAVLYTYSVGQGPYREPGMGMKFIEISDADRLFIRNFINRKLTGDIALNERHC